MAPRVDEREPAVERFILLYALAWIGGTIAYVPLLTILLPLRVEALVGRAIGVDWLAHIALAGAVAASAGGILFGFLSDITRNRRGWILAGLSLSCCLLPLMGRVQGFGQIMALVICWQLALNMMLGPLAAWAGDVVPDRRKGVLGGFMAFAPGLGALSGVVVTQPGVAAGVDVRLMLVAGMVAACVLPVLLMPMPLARRIAPSAPPASAVHPGAPFIRMWLARLAVQVAEATLFAYLYFWLLSLNPAVTDNDAARLFSLVMLGSVPFALAAGRWSDAADRPIAPLRACAMLSGLGLLLMAAADTLLQAMLAYGLFGLASAVFLALHTAQTLRILPRPDRRGRDMGILNLANTFPSLIMPWLAVLIIPKAGFPALFIVLAVMAGSAGMLLGTLGRRRVPVA